MLKIKDRSQMYNETERCAPLQGKTPTPIGWVGLDAIKRQVQGLGQIKGL